MLYYERRLNLIALCTYLRRKNDHLTTYKLKPTSFFNIYRYYLPPIGAIWESDRSITNLQFKASRIDLEQKTRVNAHFKIKKSTIYYNDFFSYRLQFKRYGRFRRFWLKFVNTKLPCFDLTSFLKILVKFECQNNVKMI